MDRIGGYALRELVGLGASGSVWAADDGGAAGVTCAVKRVHVGADAAAVDHLRAEAATLAGLDHPNIVRVLDVVEAGSDIAIVMPLAGGGSLHDLLSQRRLTPGEVVALLAPVGDALACAHRAGICHGDVKPANILLTAEGRPLLADFGAARRPAGDSAGADRMDDVRALASVVRVALGPIRHGLVTLADDVVAGRARGSDGPVTTADALADRLRRAVPHDQILLPGPAERRGPRRAGPMTRPYGPRPPARAEPVASASWRWPSRAVAALVVLGIAGGLLARAAAPAGIAPRVEVAGPRHAPRACPLASSRAPAGAGALSVDLAGDGCPAALVWHGGIVELAGPGGVARRYDFTRYGAGPGALRVGRLFVGDWDCDGTQGIAYLDPDRNVVHYFDRLPASGRLQPDAESALARRGGAHVVRRGACDSVEPGPGPAAGRGAG